MTMFRRWVSRPLSSQVCFLFNDFNFSNHWNTYQHTSLGNDTNFPVKFHAQPRVFQLISAPHTTYACREGWYSAGRDHSDQSMVPSMDDVYLQDFNLEISPLGCNKRTLCAQYWFSLDVEPSPTSFSNFRWLLVRGRLITFSVGFPGKLEL